MVGCLGWAGCRVGLAWLGLGWVGGMVGLLLVGLEVFGLEWALARLVHARSEARWQLGFPAAVCRSLRMVVSQVVSPTQHGELYGVQG